MTSVWGVIAVAILDCSLNVYACGRQKALTMPAYCVAANCNNSQATQNITMHEFARNRSAVRRKWVKFVQFKRADFDAAPRHAHLCNEHFGECDFVNFMEYQMGFASKRNLKRTAFPSVQRHSRLQNMEKLSAPPPSKLLAVPVPSLLLLLLLLLRPRLKGAVRIRQREICWRFVCSFSVSF